MTNPLNNLHTAANDARLSADEKSAMRGALLRVISHRPVKSPYWSPLFMRTGAALAIVLILGSGTTFASESALPGDMLYPLKVHVLEPVQGVTALTPIAKASWSTKLATRRAEEAEVLAAKGTLSTTTASELEEHIAQSAENARDATNEVADASTAAQLSTELDSSLSAHSDILQELGSSTPDSGTRDGARGLSRFLRRFKSEDIVVATAADVGIAAKSASLYAPTVMSMTETATITPVIQSEENESDGSLRSATRNLLLRVRNRFTILNGSLATSTSDRFGKRISEVEDELSSATDTESLTHTLKDATKLRTFLEAGDRLKRGDILDSLSKQTQEHESEDDIENEVDD